MKKLTHIAAPVALTLLLSACATPPGPGGELADQVEKVTIALADQTVEGLRDDFQEVRMQFDEVKEQAVPEHQGLMVGLEDDFVAIGKQLDEVEKQTDSNAKLDLANDLKGKLKALASQLDSLKVGVPPEPVYRKLTYKFKNLDAVDLTRKGREEYIDVLKALFGKGEDEKKYVLNTKEDFDTDGQVKSITFTLSNLGDGISEPYREEIEREIRMKTDMAPVVRGDTGNPVVKGMPVVKVASPSRPVMFQTGEVEYSSASGRAVEEVQVMSTRMCTPAKVVVDTGAIVRQREKATPHVLLDGERGKSRTSITFTFAPKGADPDTGVAIVTGDEECEYKDPSKTAYLMVLLREQDKKLPVGEYYVAEYHTVTASIPAKGGVGKAKHVPEPGRLTENKPACPPGGWERREREHFTMILNEVGGCVM